MEKNVSYALLGSIVLVLSISFSGSMVLGVCRVYADTPVHEIVSCDYPRELQYRYTGSLTVKQNSQGLINVTIFERVQKVSYLLITPSRFQMNLESGQTTTQTIEFLNTGAPVETFVNVTVTLSDSYAGTLRDTKTFIIKLLPRGGTLATLVVYVADSMSHQLITHDSVHVFVNYSLGSVTQDAWVQGSRQFNLETYLGEVTITTHESDSYFACQPITVNIVDGVNEVTVYLQPKGPPSTSPSITPWVFSIVTAVAVVAYWHQSRKKPGHSNSVIPTEYLPSLTRC